MSREHVKGEPEEASAYSRAVKVSGGATVYLAGVGGATAPDGAQLDFATQTRNAFERLRASLAEAGGALDDIVTMTVFITDVPLRGRVQGDTQGVVRERLSGERAHHRLRPGASRDARRDPGHRRGGRLSAAGCGPSGRKGVRGA